MATLQSGKCFTVPTFFGMRCRSEWQERMYIYKWHEVDQTKHEIFCSYCLQWNTSQSKFRNHYFLFLFAFSILSQLFLIWGCTYISLYMNVLNVCKKSWIYSCPIIRFTFLKIPLKYILTLPSAQTVNISGYIVQVSLRPPLILNTDASRVPASWTAAGAGAAAEKLTSSKQK